MNKLLERNIRLFYITSALMWGRFFIPVLALFYIASKVPLEQFTIIMSAFVVSTLLLEIPSGVISDILGYKNTLIISRSLYVIEVALLAFTNGFWPFLIAKVISGVGVSLSSGTNQAFLYNSLKKLKREKEHKKISGKAIMISRISMAFVFIIGAYLFKLNTKLPAYASLPLIILGLVLTFWYVEPIKNNTKLTAKNSWNHLKESMKLFFKNKKLIYIILYGLGIATIIEMTFSLSSVYIKEIKIPISLIGVIAAASSLLIAFGSKKADNIEKKLGKKKTFFLIEIVSLIGIAGMGFMIPYIGILFFLIIAFTMGIFTILLNHYLNEQSSTKHRATMLSINNMIKSACVAIFYPIVGMVSKNLGMRKAFWIVTIFAVLTIIISNIYKKVKKI